MKSTLTAILAILVIANLLSNERLFFAESKVKAQSEQRETEVPLEQAIDRYLDTEVERDRHRAHREEQSAREARHREPEGRHREENRAAIREHERHLDQQRHRIQKMHVAAEHLQEAGLPDLAHQVHREAEEQAQRLQQQFEHRHHPEHNFHREVQESLHDLRNEVHALKREVHELRSVIAERAPSRD